MQLWLDWTLVPGKENIKKVFGSIKQLFGEDNRLCDLIKNCWWALLTLRPHMVFVPEYFVLKNNYILLP